MTWKWSYDKYSTELNNEDLFYFLNQSTWSVECFIFYFWSLTIFMILTLVLIDNWSFVLTQMIMINDFWKWRYDKYSTEFNNKDLFYFLLWAHFCHWEELKSHDHLISRITDQKYLINNKVRKFKFWIFLKLEDILNILSFLTFNKT